MVKVSHARCRRCGQTRHRNARWNLCRVCWNVEKERRQQGWRDIKERRALKRNGHIPPQEVPVPLSIADAVEEVLAEVPNKPRVVLTSEQKQEIVSLYTTTETPVNEIAETYGIASTAPFRILSEAGVTWRRGDRTPESRPGPKRELPPQIAAMQEVHVASTPAPTRRLTEDGNIVPVAASPAPKARPSVPAVGLIDDDPERIVPVNLNGPEPTNLDLPSAADLSAPAWHIEFSGALDLQAANFDDAVKLARELGAIDITLVRKL